MPTRFSEVVPNKLYRGGEPDQWEVAALKTDFGIEQIISLDDRAGEEIASTCKKNNIIHKIIELDASDPFALNLSLIKTNVSKLIGDKKTYVHCHHGKDRTGLFVAKYRTENGMSCKEALDEAIKFGFGLGMNDVVVAKYINIINGSCKENHEHINLQDFYQATKKIAFCPDCGLTKQSLLCENCFIVDALIKNAYILSKNITNEMAGINKGKNIVDMDRAKEEEKDMQKDDENLGGGSEVSTLFSLPESITASRKQRVNILKNINKVAQQVTFKIPNEEKQQAKKCIEKLEDLVENILLKVKVKDEALDILDIIYNPFNENEGLTTDQAKKIKGHLEIFTKIINNNMIQIKNSAVFCLDILETFKSDADVASMNKSFFDEIDNLDKEEQMFEKLLDNVENKDFQKDILNAIKVLKKSSAQLKQLINERIIPYLRKDVLGDDWTTEIKQTLQKDKIENISVKEKK